MNTMMGWEAHIPVLEAADVVIIGGSLAGIACAVELAKGDLRVMIIEPRTYLGREMTAPLRPWLELSSSEIAKAPELIGFIAEQAGEEAFADTFADAATYLPLHPDRLKRALEDKLMAHAIRFLYASLPVAVVREEEGAALQGLVIANKTGSQFIPCAAIIDMTETGIVSRLGGGSAAWPAHAGTETAVYARTLEFTGVTWPENRSSLLDIPEHVELPGHQVRLRKGYRDESHFYVEYTMMLPSENELDAAGRRERKARRNAMALTNYLVQQVPAFRKAVLCGASFELHGPVGVDAEIQSVSSGWTFARGLADVYCLYEQGPAGAMIDPVLAVQAGLQLASQMIAERAVNAKADADADADANANANAKVNALPADRITVKSEISMLDQVEVLVIGGGSSGACAAITAGDEGVRTMLVDMNPGLGGTGTFGGVDSYWFGRREGFAARIHEAVQSVQQDIGYKGHKWNIEAKMFALQRLAEENGSQLLYNAFTYAAIKEGNRVTGVLTATRWGPYAIRSDVVIDATGDGDVAAFAGAEFIYGSAKDHTVMWYSLAQWKSPDKLQNNFTSMVDVSDISDYTRAIVAGRRRGADDLHDHGIYVATRESRHIIGETVMQLSDQLLQRSWPDAVNIHFSNHDVKGVSGADWINIGLIPPNLEIEIPFRALLPKTVDGLLVAGKAISATHDALPAIRMQSDLENLGGVAALAAAQAVRTGVTPRSIEIAALQDRLIGEGILPSSVRSRQLAPVTYDDDALRQLVDSIETEQPLYEYANMRMNEIYKKPIPFVEICSLGKRIVPFLIEALHTAEGTRQTRLAQALAMLGSQEAVPVLIDRIMAELQGDELPRRTADMMYVQLPPDHGAMPDVVYLLYSLAQTKDSRSIAVWERVAGMLQPSEEDFKDTWLGLYYYIDAIAQGAERLGDRAAIPVLEKLQHIPYLHAQMTASVPQADYFLERRAMLELALGRALARCGCKLGYDILIAYISDGRSLLAKGALQQLKAISGLSLGKEPQSWITWLHDHEPYRHTYPLQTQLDMETNSESILRAEGTLSIR